MLNERRALQSKSRWRANKPHSQVNTSGEESKFGVEPAEAPELAKHIHSGCKHLHFRGLMTIGECRTRRCLPACFPMIAPGLMLLVTVGECGERSLCNAAA